LSADTIRDTRPEDAVDGSVMMGLPPSDSAAPRMKIHLSADAGVESGDSLRKGGEMA